MGLHDLGTGLPGHRVRRRSVATGGCSTVAAAVIVHLLIFQQGLGQIAPLRAGQSRHEKVIREHAISADTFETLIGKDAILYLNSGKHVEDVKIHSFTRGRDKALFRVLSVQSATSSNPSRYPGGLLFELEVEGSLYRVSRVLSQRAFVLIDEAARNREIQRRLSGQRARLWQKIPAAEQAEHVVELKEFLREVAAHFGPLQMQLHETEYFLFLTDMPSAHVAPYLANLDDMNERLGHAFGFRPGANVWYGKAVIVAFVNQLSFVEFEQHFMQNTNTAEYQGICHQNSRGRVVVGCYRGNHPAQFASLLVHETSHGYVHRYKSTARLPSWLNEGIADWIAAITVPRSTVVHTRQKRSAERLRQLGTFGGRFFQATQIDPLFYGSASSCVDLLIRHDADSFRLLVDGIKEGYSWQESLQRAYGLSPADVAAAYGRAIGVPSLAP